MYIKSEFPLGLIKLWIVTLNLLIDSVFLIFQYGKKWILRYLFLAGIELILFCAVERVRYAPSLTSLW